MIALASAEDTDITADVAMNSTTTNPSDNLRYAHLIDFDLSGEEHKRKYPGGFNHEIEDGGRHCDAQGNTSLHRSHDIYSLAYIFARCQPAAVEAETWREMVLGMKSNGLIKTMDTINTFLLSIGNCSVHVNSLGRNGSPDFK